MTTDQANARASWETSYHGARELLSGLDAADLDRPTDNSRWTVRNLAAHIATNDSFIAQCVKPLSQGKSLLPVPIPRWLAFKLGDMANRRNVGRHRNASVAELVSVLDETHQRAATALDQVSDDGWNRPGTLPGFGRRTLAELVAEMTQHNDEHAETVRKAVTTAA